MFLAKVGKLTSQYINIVNLVMFQGVWWLSILYQNAAFGFSLGLLLFHFMLSSRMQSDVILMLKVVLLGIAVDSLLTYGGIFHFSETPYWLILLWCHFAISLGYSLAFTQKLPWYINALLGGVFGCLSYLAGARFDAVHLPLEYLTSAMILFAIWIVIFPMFVYVSRRTLKD
ncbi:MAG: hypothetical protein ACI8SJ_001310 [Shewanella sp.]|jgi:hypothetical protein